MAVHRFFTCECGHKLRFGAKQCGKCYWDTPPWNRQWFWLFAATVIISTLALAVTVVVSVLS